MAIVNILLLAIFVGALISLPFFLKWLAKGDILYTEVPERTAKAIMRSGSLDHFVMSLKEYHLNKPGSRRFDPTKPEWEVLKNRPNKNYDDRNPLSRWLGLYWVGIPPFRKVYSYTFA